MIERPEEREPVWITSVEAGIILDLTERYVRDLARKGEFDFEYRETEHVTHKTQMFVRLKDVLRKKGAK